MPGAAAASQQMRETQVKKGISNARGGALKLAIAGVAATICAGGGPAFAAPAFAANESGISGRTIGYVLTTRTYGIYQAMDAAGKETNAECPKGLYDFGAREQFAAMYPQIEGKKYRLADTTIAREAEVWWPKDGPDKFPVQEIEGRISYGVDLDGKVKPGDFTSPDGKPGIDNQLYRAVGCIPSYRLGSSQVLFETQYFESRTYNRTIIELTDVDSLENDDDVTITTYRGLDALVRDAKGDFQVDTTQRIDTIYGRDFIHTFKGKIVAGVLTTTKSGDFVWPTQHQHEEAATELMHDTHFELKLSPEKIEGAIAGYIDIESHYRGVNRRFGSHQISYGKLDSRSFYKALRRLADAYPDPETGANTAISGTLMVTGVRARVVHPEKQVADTDVGPDHGKVSTNGAR